MTETSTPNGGFLAGEGTATSEYFHFAVAALLLVLLLIHAYRRRSLSVPAICFIAGFSIFWQEFYADWGSYMLWSPKFNMMPWGPTLWTTPSKPWFVMWAYPAFMCVSLTLMVFITDFVRKKAPTAPLFVLSVLVAGPILWLINFYNEYNAVVNSGHFTYVEIMGPALTSEKGASPLLWPVGAFAFWGATITYLIINRAANGFPAIERIIHEKSYSSPVKREAARALLWIVVFNLTYWFLVCTPAIAVRILFGPPSALVP